METRKKPMDKERARQLRNELYDAVNRGELGLQEAVKKMRQISGLTQAEFAAHRGVSPKVIKEIERGIGNPTINTLNQIGQFFGLQVAFVRSEKLQTDDVPIRQQYFSKFASNDILTSLACSPVYEAKRLTEELEDIKRLVSPPKSLQNALKSMESDLQVIREAQKISVQKEEISQSRSRTELERAMKVVDSELRAVKEARSIIESAEKIQRQIQPPSGVERWLIHIEVAKRVLSPLDEFLELSSKSDLTVWRKK